jgi:hypothetical protein
LKFEKKIAIPIEGNGKKLKISILKFEKKIAIPIEGNEKS